jgi:hypothetical protein
MSLAQDRLTVTFAFSNPIFSKRISIFAANRFSIRLRTGGLFRPSSPYLTNISIKALTNSIVLVFSKLSITH